MARKSRRKQRSKGAGSRSSKAKSSGKSQGGSRSGGKSRSSSSSKSKSSSSKSKSSSSSRGRSGAGTGGGQKSNPTKKTTTVSTKTTTQTKSPTKTVSTKTKQGKDRTPAQIAAATRIGEGTAKKPDTTISQIKAANTKKIQDAARIRDQKFKQTGVQTLGGTKTSFTDAEQAKIKAAGYTVDGYSKAAARSDADVDAFRAAAKAKQEAEAAAKAAAERKAADEKLARQFDPSRLLGGALTQTSAGIADNFAKPSFMYQGNPLNRTPGLSNYFSPDAGAAATYSRSGAFKGIPFAGGSATGTLTKFNVPDGAKIGRSPLGIRQFKLTPNQMSQLGKGVTVAGDDAAKLAAKGLGKYGARAVPFAGAALSLADAGMRIRDKDYTGAALAAASAIPGPVGLAALGGLAFKDVRSAMNAPKQVASTEAGGLNIGGGVDSGEASAKPSGLARVITGAADKVMRDTTDFDRRGREKNFLADAFTQTNTALKTIKPYFDAAKGQDDKSIRKQASNLLTDIGSKEELAPVARGIKAFTTDNPNVPNKFGLETLSDIRDTFTPGKPKIPSIDPKSGIVGMIGNRMLAGDIKNIVKEADQQTGVEKGATRTLGQTINVAKQIGKNLGDTSTQGYKSAQKIKKLVGTATGKPTPGSIIKGVNPFGNRSKRGSTPAFTPSSAPSFTPSGRTGGGGTPVRQVPQIPPTTQFQVPEIPQQQGLDAGNLANIQNQSYQDTFKNLMAINPNYSARFQMRRRGGGRRGSFRKAFSRRFFR